MIESYNNLQEKVQQLETELRVERSNLGALRDELVSLVDTVKYDGGYRLSYATRQFVVQRLPNYAFTVISGGAVLLSNYRGSLYSIQLKIALGQI